MARAAAETAKELLAAAADEEKGFQPGLVAVVQTFPAQGGQTKRLFIDPADRCQWPLSVDAPGSFGALG